MASTSSPPSEQGRFSVIIPTLQMSTLLPGLVATYDAHPLVGEILVINNAPQPLHLSAAKLRVLQQSRNLFVNPAWNLGAREARYPLLAISNDDIDIDMGLLDAVARRLAKGGVGIIGGDLSDQRRRKGNSRFRRLYRRPEGFGVLMFMPADHYSAIPTSLKIWQGDDYLFHRQTKRNYAFQGFRLDTPHHVTANRPEFSEQKSADFALYMEQFHADSAYYKQLKPDFLTLRAALKIYRTLRPLPRAWEER